MKIMKKIKGMQHCDRNGKAGEIRTQEEGTTPYAIEGEFERTIVLFQREIDADVLAFSQLPLFFRDMVAVEFNHKLFKRKITSCFCRCVFW